MRSFLSCAFALALSLFSLPARAETDLTGWWRADIAYGDDSEPLYFHFTTTAQGAPLLRLSEPVVRWEDVAASHYTIQGATLTLTDLNLTLTLNVSADGRTIDTVLPVGVVGLDPTPAHFVRTDAPARLAPLPEPLGPPPSPRWTVPLHAEVWGGIVRDGARAIFVADTAGHVTALAQSNGARLWQADLGSQIRATPTLRNGTLYVASDAALAALDARTGRRIWSAPFGQQRSTRLPTSDPNSLWDHYSSGVAVDDELAIAGSRDGCVHAVRTRTGAEVWRHCTENIVTSTPALTRDAVYFGGFDHYAYALSRADGHVLWRYDTHEAIPRDAVIAGDNVLFGSRNFDLIALNARTGERTWFRRMWYSWVDSPPVIADGRIYVGSSDALNIFAYDQANGHPVWKAHVPGWSWGGVALGADSLYTGIVGDTYRGGPRAGGFAAYNRADGTLRWRLDAPRPDPMTMYGFASLPAVSGARVFAADLNGNVYAFDDPHT